MPYWLKVAGSADDPFVDNDWRPRDRAWREQYGAISAFPNKKRPTGIQKGDTLILYAAGSAKTFGEGRLIAVDQVVSREPEPSGHARWGWSLKVRRMGTAPFLSMAPTLSDIDVELKSLARKSHIKLSYDQGSHAEHLIRAEDKRVAARSHRVSDGPNPQPLGEAGT
jgi:hypothetical protein